jgi:capsular exopolysaccharide synthesis family protein
MIFGRKKVDNVSGNTMMHKKLSFAATEAYKLLRTNLMFTLPDENKCRIIGVTSAIRGEGKSTTAVNLSYTIAETGKRVLLIDADLRLPTVAKKLEINATPGLSNVLAGTVEEGEATWTSEDIENWVILPSGDVPPNPTEMLSSSQMKSLMERLAQVYDFIVIDLPPVNIVSDALVASSFLDGIVVVIRENYSGRRELASCMRHLELSGTKILGFVMNTASESKTPYKKYRYYKRYGSSYASDYAGYSGHSEDGEAPVHEPSPDEVTDESVDEAWLK